jgi:hypothetical protein
MLRRSGAGAADYVPQPTSLARKRSPRGVGAPKPAIRGRLENWHADLEAEWSWRAAGVYEAQRSSDSRRSGARPYERHPWSERMRSEQEEVQRAPDDEPDLLAV